MKPITRLAKNYSIHWSTLKDAITNGKLKGEIVAKGNRNIYYTTEKNINYWYTHYYRYREQPQRSGKKWTEQELQIASRFDLDNACRIIYRSRAAIKTMQSKLRNKKIPWERRSAKPIKEVQNE